MQQFINNWSTTITQALSPSDTVVHIDIESANRLAVGFQQGDYYLLTLDDGVNVEVVKVVGINGDQVSVNRAQEGPVIHNWNLGAKIEMRITAKILFKFETIIDKIITANGELLVSPNGNVLYK